MLLDTVNPVETPEGVGIQYRLAGPSPRACAWLLDLCIRAVVLFVFSMIIGFAGVVMGQAAMGLTLIFMFALEWLYPVLFEVFNDGQTPGKQIMKLRAVHENGTPIGWSASLLRNLLRTADLLPFGYFTGLLVMLFSERFQRLGDMIAGTVVIYVKKQEVDYASLPAVAAKPPAHALKLEEQRAVIAFAERHERLSGARMEELADLLKGHRRVEGREAVEGLFGEAAWLVGERR